MDIPEGSLKIENLQGELVQLAVVNRGEVRRKMISEAILVATVSGAFSVLSNIVISRKRSQENEINNALREQRQVDRLDRLEKKVDEHNGYARRFGEIEKSIVRIETKMGDIVNGTCKVKE